MHKFTSKITLNLSKLQFYSISKRFYPGNNNLKKLFENLFKPNILPKASNNIDLSFSQSVKKDNLPQLKTEQVSKSNIIKKQFQESNLPLKNFNKNAAGLPKSLNEKTIHSGLLTVPPEYFTKEILFQKEFNYAVICVYFKTLFNLGKYNIHDDEALFKNIDKLFLSMSELYNNMKYNEKWIDMTAAMTQHVLRSLFLDKKFPREAFEKYMNGDVDFIQYSHGDILLVIESFIGKNTLKDLLKQISFIAINHEIPEEQRPGYSKKVCQQLTGQENADFHGKRAIVHKNGDISLETNHYKDAKTFDSGVLKGRLAIRYDLYSNLQNATEQATKLLTSMQKNLKDPKINENAKKILTELYKKLKREIDAFFSTLKTWNYDSITKTLKDPKDHQIVKEHFMKIYKIIYDAILNPEISQSINFGITFDPGIDLEFITFSKEHLQVEYKYDLLTKEIVKVLYNNTFDKEAHRQLLEKMIKHFPEEMQSSIQKSIYYIDNK